MASAKGAEAQASLKRFEPVVELDDQVLPSDYAPKEQYIGIDYICVVSILCIDLLVCSRSHPQPRVMAQIYGIVLHAGAGVPASCSG